MEEKLKPYIQKFKQLSFFKQALITVVAIFIFGKIIGSLLSAISQSPAPKEAITQSTAPSKPIEEKLTDRQLLESLSPTSQVEVKYALSCKHTSGDVVRIVALGEAASLTMNSQIPSEYKEAILLLTNTSEAEYNFKLIPIINWLYAGKAVLNRQTLWLYTELPSPYGESGAGYQCVPIEDKEGALANLKNERQAYKDYADAKKQNQEIESQKTKENLIRNQKI